MRSARGVANLPTVPIRFAQEDDLPAIVDIYNASIPGRLATADTTPVRIEERRAWFAEFDPRRRPLWVTDEPGSGVVAWLSLRSFYGRPAYHATVESAVYTAPSHHRRGLARALVAHALDGVSALEIKTVLAFVFAHNTPSVRLFETFGFVRWGLLPRVAELDGIERDLAILGRRVD